MRKAIIRHNLAVHLIPIETGLSAQGVPDINMCCGGVEAWVENKAADHNKIKFRPLQPQWHIRRAAVGGRSFILCRSEKLGLLLWKGAAVHAVQEQGIFCQTGLLHISSGDARQWDWLSVFRHIFGAEALDRRRLVGIEATVD